MGLMREVRTGEQVLTENLTRVRKQRDVAVAELATLKVERERLWKVVGEAEEVIAVHHWWDTCQPDRQNEAESGLDDAVDRLRTALTALGEA